VPLNTKDLVLEAIKNAADNGFPVDDLTDKELTEDLWLRAGFASGLSIEIVEAAVKEARHELSSR
jgi:hypothetical protein